jgi:hypothetical protein
MVDLVVDAKREDRIEIERSVCRGLSIRGIEVDRFCRINQVLLGYLRNWVVSGTRTRQILYISRLPKTDGDENLKRSLSSPVQ